MNRRDFLKKLAVATLAGWAGTRAVAGLRPCIVHHQRIALQGLPTAFDGIRVAQLSDFHHGPLVPKSLIRQAVTLTNSLNPHLIVVTGDFIHRGGQWAPDCFRELAQLHAPMGVYGVLGNHDHYENAAEKVRKGMRAARIQDLTNCGVDLDSADQTLRVAGVGDLWKEKQSLRSALGRNRTYSILLSHNPDFAEEIRDERVGLVLSGHTHGGQCVFPLIGAPILPSQYGQRYASGLCHAPHCPVFVTTGVGHSFPPLRINCPAEVALLTLTANVS